MAGREHAARRDLVRYGENIVRTNGLFVWLIGISVATTLTANIIAAKLIVVGGLVLPAAVILFPLTYILSDVLTEVYGYRQSMVAVWLNVIANGLMVLFFGLAIACPAAPMWNGSEAFQTVLGTTPRIATASIAAYFVGDYLNSASLSIIKRRTQGRHMLLRTVGSTVIGQAADSGLFILIAFGGVVPGVVLWQMAWAQYVWKVLYEVVASPLTHLVIGWAKRIENIDVCDEAVSYSPFNVGANR